MPISSFEALYGALCEREGLEAAALKPDSHGTLAFEMRPQGVVVNAIELAADRGRKAVFMAEMGDPPQAQALQAWTLLLRANAFLAGRDVPHFSRDARSGQALAQSTCHYSDATVFDAHQNVVRLVAMARQWQAALHGDAALPPPAASCAAQGACAEAASFEALYRQVCEALRSPPAPLAASGGVSMFSLRHEHRRVNVVHAPLVTADAAIVTLHLGGAWDASRLDIVTALMDANFALLTQPHDARFCMNPQGTGLLLQYMFALTGATAEGLLAQIARLAALVQQWEWITSPAAGTPTSAKEAV